MLGGNARDDPVLATGSFGSQVWPLGTVQGEKMERNKFPVIARWELLQSIAAIMFAAATMRHSSTWCAGISQKTDSLIRESDTFSIVLFLKQGLTLAKANLELGVLLPFLPRVLELERDMCQNTNLTLIFLVSLVFIVSCNKL